MVKWWLWSYVGISAVAVLWFLRWSRNTKGIPRIAYLLVVVILVWSLAWHLVMALGIGETGADDRRISWAHYADWIVTAPLLLVALVLTATHALSEKRAGLVLTLLLGSFPIILSGLAADLLVDEVARFAVYGVGMLGLGIVVALIWGPLRATAEAQPSAMASHFRLTALVLSVLWFCFPLVWILGPPGVGIVDAEASAVLFATLSALMKIGWSLLDIGRLRRLSDRGLLHVD
ncbi:hypothetical protein GCM10022225_04470 [Plantactinospora mayteni]|uniref:Bacteriorhodopsin n=1 Tax=Plantactinospora mayteni TaxID=566021 RepID=A0ABQ4EQK3_9ACTN|nr:bacteriorhodopsin [Plantactinospora mayteni]GIG96936.1 hypothetical protein Pma05_35090 [Plantactinospora mayteni]